MIEELYHSYQKELTAWCRGMTQNASLADDLVQEAFLRALINSQLLEHLRENQRRNGVHGQDRDFSPCGTAMPVSDFP